MIVHYTVALLTDLFRRPASIVVHLLTAAVSGLLMLPSTRDGYATLMVAGQPIAYTSDSVSTILGVLYASFYPLVGATLLTTTLRAPLPRDLLAVIPTRRFILMAGMFVGSATILLAHLLFVSVMGSMRGLGWSAVEQLPVIIVRALIIALPAVALTASLVAIIEAGPFAYARASKVAIVAVWLGWMTAVGLSLGGGVSLDPSGVGVPLRQIIGNDALSTMSLGFVVSVAGSTSRWTPGVAMLEPDYLLQQTLRSLFWLVPLGLMGAGMLRGEPAGKAPTYMRRQPVAFPSRGFEPLTAIKAIVAVLLQLLRRLFRGKIMLVVSMGLIASEIFAPAGLTQKLLYVGWGIYLVRWAEIGRLVAGTDFLELERSFPLNGPVFAGIAIIAVAIQMLLLASGRLLAYPDGIELIAIQVTVVSVSSVLSIRVTRSESPFLILGLVCWYGMLTA